MQIFNTVWMLITSGWSSTGLTHTPRSDKSEVFFNLNDVGTYLPYTKALKDFLAKYDEEIQRDQMKFEDCGGKFYSLIFFLPLHEFIPACPTDSLASLASSSQNLIVDRL